MLAGVETDGLDFEADYSFDTSIGTFSQNLTISHVLNFDQDEGRGVFLEQLDEAFTPDMRAMLSLGWASGDFSATVIGLPEAYLWLDARFRGVPARSNC